MFGLQPDSLLKLHNGGVWYHGFSQLSSDINESYLKRLQLQVILKTLLELNQLLVYRFGM